MFAYALIAIELCFFGFALWAVFRKNADQYKVSKDIWGVYAEVDQNDHRQDDSVLIFSKKSTTVRVVSLDDRRRPQGPKGPTRSAGRAA